MSTTFSNILVVLKKIGKALGKFFIWAFSDVKRLLILLLGIALLYLIFSYNALEKRYNEDCIMYTDSLTTYVNKNKELYAAKTAYEVDLSRLKSLNNDLYQEVKNLKDHPLIVTKTEIEYRYIEIDATENELVVETDTVANDTIYRSNFRYTDDWTNIDGYTTFSLKNRLSNTHFNSISMNTDLYLDLIEKGNNFHFIAKSSNPYVQINNIDGYLISPETSKLLKKKFNKPWGIMIGVGPSIIVDDNSIKIKPALQLTVGYKFISF